MNKHLTIESAEEASRFGFDVTYDGDNQNILYGTKCNHCGKYFKSKKIDIYCDECKKKHVIIYGMSEFQ